MKANLAIVLSALTAIAAAVSAGNSGFRCIASINIRPAVSSTAPAPSPGTLPRGRSLFVQSCAHCHGDDAHGSGEDSDGPDLYRLRLSNARIAAVIRKGIPDEMPSFERKHGSQDIADLTAYLRSLK